MTNQEMAEFISSDLLSTSGHHILMSLKYSDDKAGEKIHLDKADKYYRAHIWFMNQHPELLSTLTK